MAEETTTPQADTPSSARTPPRAANGWDGKLRLPKDDEDLSETADDDDSEDDEQPPGGVQLAATPAPPGFPSTEVQGAQIDADEDLLDDIPDTETDIDLNHCRVSSVSTLRLERFPALQRLCLRQNHITTPDFPRDWGAQLVDLDLYDNSIGSIKGLDALTGLTSLDLSFNKLKHIKRIEHLTALTDLYFVQNKLSRIENLSTLTNLTNLELAANRIREIENLDALTNLRELWLGKNKIAELKNLSALTNLRVLSIQSNRLTSPSLAHLATLPALSELYISHNAIDSLAPLAGSTGLKTLDVSSNPLASLSGLEDLTELEEVWASDCNLDSFEALGAVLGSKPALHTVYLEGNPLQTRQRALYRGKVRLALPRVAQIDAVAVRPALDGG